MEDTDWKEGSYKDSCRKQLPSSQISNKIPPQQNLSSYLSPSEHQIPLPPQG